jgi:hypothetical protein
MEWDQTFNQKKLENNQSIIENVGTIYNFDYSSFLCIITNKLAFCAILVICSLNSI